jgi:hypothetical protein
MRHFAQEQTRRDVSIPRRGRREAEQSRGDRSAPTHVRRSLDQRFGVQIPASQPHKITCVIYDFQRRVISTWNTFARPYSPGPVAGRAVAVQRSATIRIVRGDDDCRRERAGRSRNLTATGGASDLAAQRSLAASSTRRYLVSAAPGKRNGNTMPVVNTHRSLCPHSGTMMIRCFAPSTSFTYLTKASPRARRVGP